MHPSSQNLLITAIAVIFMLAPFYLHLIDDESLIVLFTFLASLYPTTLAKTAPATSISLIASAVGCYAAKFNKTILDRPPPYSDGQINSFLAALLYIILALALLHYFEPTFRGKLATLEKASPYFPLFPLISPPIVWLINYRLYLGAFLPEFLVSVVNLFCFLMPVVNAFAPMRSAELHLTKLRCAVAASNLYLALNGAISLPLFVFFTMLVVTMVKARVLFDVGEKESGVGNGMESVKVRLSGVWLFFLGSMLVYHTSGLSYKMSSITVFL